MTVKNIMVPCKFWKIVVHQIKMSKVPVEFPFIIRVILFNVIHNYEGYRWKKVLFSCTKIETMQTLLDILKRNNKQTKRDGESNKFPPQINW